MSGVFKRYPRVVAFTQDVPTACDYWRITIPFRTLQAAGYPVAVQPASAAGRVLLREIDVIVLPRWGWSDPNDLARFRGELRRAHVAFVWDTDDDLFQIPPDSPAYAPDTTEPLSLALRAADWVTVSTPHLAEQLQVKNPNVTVLPNLIDPAEWITSGRRAQHRAVKGLTVGVHGGATHYHDWLILQDLLPAIAERYSDVTFVVAGYCPPYLDALGLGDRLVRLAWTTLERYRYNVASIDIALCPLADTPFNRSKSAIKWMESAICGSAVVASPTVYADVITHGETGFIARALDEWVQYVSLLIEDRDLRRRIGKAAQQRVLKSHTVHQRAQLERRMNAYRAAWEHAYGCPFEPRYARLGGPLGIPFRAEAGIKA